MDQYWDPIKGFKVLNRKKHMIRNKMLQGTVVHVSDVAHMPFIKREVIAKE